MKAHGREHLVSGGPDYADSMGRHHCGICGFTCDRSPSFTNHMKSHSKNAQQSSSVAEAPTPGIAVADHVPGALIATMLQAASTPVPDDVALTLVPDDEAAVMQQVVFAGDPGPDMESQTMTGAKRRRDGAFKMTKGAAQRNRYTDLQIIDALEAHDGACSLGAKPRTDDDKTAGAKVPYTTLVK